MGSFVAGTQAEATGIWNEGHPTGFPCILALSKTLTLDHGIPNSAGLELAIAEGIAYESLHIII